MRHKGTFIIRRIGCYDFRIHSTLYVLVNRGVRSSCPQPSIRFPSRMDESSSFLRLLLAKAVLRNGKSEITRPLFLNDLDR